LDIIFKKKEDLLFCFEKAKNDFDLTSLFARARALKLFLTK